MQDYLHYFRAVGKVLAWETEYPHADRLVLTLLSLRDIDHLDGRNLTLAIAECELFGTWLHELHERISQLFRDIRLDELCSLPTATLLCNTLTATSLSMRRWRAA